MNISSAHFVIVMIVSALAGFFFGCLDPRLPLDIHFLLFKLFLLFVALMMPVGQYFIWGDLLWPKEKSKR